MEIRLLLLSLSILISSLAYTQTGSIRGNIYDKEDGEPVIFATVSIEGTSLGTNTDLDGFFTLPNVPVGTQKVVVTFVGYQDFIVEVEILKDKIQNVQYFLEKSSVQLKEVQVSGSREQARNETTVSKVTITPKQVKSLPSIGGQADLAQYLPVLPGIVFSGDQGGQLYIRGGSPVQNMMLLDGMVIYNPFHSIGFYSVFETEAIRTIDVYTGGFNAEYGGRASAVVDIKTREGNKRRFAGLVSASPFQAKVLLEGPISKLKEGGGGSISYLITAKQSFIDETSKALYSYAVDTALYNRGVAPENRVAPEDIGLPFRFTDLYGKISMLGNNGTQLNVFGFNFEDEVRYPGVNVDWSSFGAGLDFKVVPANSDAIIGGLISFSDYEIMLAEIGESPRRSRINSFSAGLDFSYFGNNSEFKYGFQVRGLTTELAFRNFSDITINHDVNTTEISGFFKYRKKINNLIIEPSFRLHFYASLNEASPEPRLSVKYNVSEKFRLKAAGGLYSQNLIGTVRDDDVVNLFTGFITDPEESFNKLNTDEPVDHKLQKAAHGIFGAEVDVSDKVTINVEPYFKRFSQIVNLNRNKTEATDSDYATEEGDAYGIDFSLKYETRKYYFWVAYSLARVDRFDGIQEYPPVFDRRHNINILGTYSFGPELQWEASARWNYGTGFPFNLTQGFYNRIEFEEEGITTDPLTNNTEIGQILSEDRNSGRLPTYSRLDLSIKYTHKFKKNLILETTASVTNVLDRENIFFADPTTLQRINQLPILPSLGVTFSF